jgi:hypothetical protein
MNRRSALLLLSAALTSPAYAQPQGPTLAAQPRPPQRAPSPADRLIAAARAQIGVTTRYDPAYVRLAFPGGDVPRDRGVCSDVVIRAYRDAFGIDLQADLAADMRRAFSAYPKRWGLTRPDANIDHRRVPNLETLFVRRGRVLPLGDPASFQPGDLVTQRLPGALPHIVIVTRATSPQGLPMVVHNVGAGARLEDVLAIWPVVGRFRYGPTA